MGMSNKQPCYSAPSLFVKISDGEKLPRTPACVNRHTVRRMTHRDRSSSAANGMSTVLSTQADLREDLNNSVEVLGSVDVAKGDISPLNLARDFSETREMLLSLSSLCFC